MPEKKINISPEANDFLSKMAKEEKRSTQSHIEFLIESFVEDEKEKRESMIFTRTNMIGAFDLGIGIGLQKLTKFQQESAIEEYLDELIEIINK